MGILHDRFTGSMGRLGLTRLPCDLFHTAPCALRFQIGGQEDIYLADHRKPNGAYLDHATDRALEIYEKLPAAPRILRIDGCPELKVSGLPGPEERASESFYWDLRKEKGFLRKLLREIVRAELDPGGYEHRVSSVYFLHPGKDVLFQLCDDRWADAAAPDAGLLRPLYEACGPWR